MTDPWLQVARQDPWLKQAEADPWLQEAQSETSEVEPTAEDLEKYRRMGVKQYRSPAGKLYDLEPTESETEPIGFLEGFFEDIERKVPFTPVVAKDIETARAASRLQKDEYKLAFEKRNNIFKVLSDKGIVPKWLAPKWDVEKEKVADVKKVEEYINRVEEKEKRGYTGWGKFGAGVSILPRWMIEFALTGGLKKIGSAATRKFLDKRVKSELAKRGASWIVGSAVRTTAGLPHRVGEEIVERRMREEPENWATSVAKGWGEVFVEAASEEAGGAITSFGKKWLGKSISKMPFGKKFLDGLYKFWKKTRPQGTWAAFMNNITKKGGYSNLIGEYGEERLATLMHSILKTEDFGAGPDASIWERLKAGYASDFEGTNILVELGVLSVPGAVRFGLGRIGTKAQKERSEALKANINATIEAIREEGRLTREERVSAEAQIDEMDAELAQIQRTAVQEGRKAVEPTRITPPAPKVAAEKGLKWVKSIPGQDWATKLPGKRYAKYGDWFIEDTGFAESQVRYHIHDETGAVVTNRPTIKESIAIMRQWGVKPAPPAPKVAPVAEGKVRTFEEFVEEGATPTTELQVSAKADGRIFLTRAVETEEGAHFHPDVLEFNAEETELWNRGEKLRDTERNKEGYDLQQQAKAKAKQRYLESIGEAPTPSALKRKPAKPTRKEKLAEEKSLERELTGISRQKRTKLIGEVEAEIEKSDIYQATLDSVETEAGVIGPGYYYVPEKFRSEVEDIIGKKKGAGTKLQQMFAFKPTDKRIVKLPTGEKAEIGPTDWTRAVQEALGRGREGIEDTTGYMNIADFVQRVKDSFESGEEAGRLNARALEAAAESGDPYTVMLAEKHRLLRGGATAQQIDDMIREWAEYNKVDVSAIEDEFVGDEALRLKEIKAIKDEAEREKQLDLLAEENVTKRMRAEAAQAVKEVLKDNDVEAEVREVEEIEEEDLPFERRGKPTGAAVITPSGEQIVLLAYGADSETGYHEGYHILRRRLTDRDIRILDKRYQGNEEAEAADFAVFVKENKAPNSIIRVIWNKLKAILQKIKSGLEGKGYRTVEDIYKELAGGRIALADLPVRGFATAYERGLFGPIEEQLRLPFKERQAAIKRVEAEEEKPLPSPAEGVKKAVTAKTKPYAAWRPRGRVKIKSKLIKGVDNEIEKSMKPRSNAVQITPEQIAAKMGALYMPDYFYNPVNPLPEIQEAFNQLVKGGPLFDIRYEREPVFYSKLERLVTDKMPAKMDAEQFKRWLVKQGIKADEMKWSGVNELTGKITKQQVLDTIAANNIQIEEVEKGDEETNYAQERMTRIEQQLENKQISEQDKEKLRLEYKKIADEIREKTPTKFQQYVIPGGERYRELLLRMPEKEQRYSVRHVDDGTGSGRKVWQIYDIITGDTHRTKTGLPSITYEVKRDALERADKLNREKVSIESVVKSVTKITPGQGFEVKMQDGRKFRFSHAKSRQEAIDFLKIQYREGLIDIGPRTTIFRAAHWEETNVLAHVRFDDRTDSEGKKILFIEEIQSDWHQVGRKKGYRGEAYTLDEMELKEGDKFYNITPRGNEAHTYALYKAGVTKEEAKEKALAYFAKSGIKPMAGVPDAPFKKTWHELALKRMLRYAVANGYDKLAWTTGEQQAERYDLSKLIESVNAIKGKQGISLTVTTKEGQNVIDSKLVQQNELDNIIGKELADKIRQQKEPDRTYSGLDLKVGGEGMKSFYDRMIPQFLNKYTKKWGGRVGETKLEIPAEVSKLPWQVYADNQLYDAFRTREQATEFIDSQEGTIPGLGGEELKLELAYEAEAVPETVPSLAITDTMKKSVMAGQVMFELSREKLERDLYKKAAKNAEKARLKAIGGLTPKKKKGPALKRIKIQIDTEATPALREKWLEGPPRPEIPPPPTKPSARGREYSDEWYRNNTKKLKRRFLTEPAEFIKAFGRGADFLAGATLTRLRNIAPEIARRVSAYEFRYLDRTASQFNVVEPFIKATKKMKKQDWKELDLALKNRDHHKVYRILAKYDKKLGVIEKYERIRDVDDEIWQAANEVGMDVRYLYDHWHRYVKDKKGFLKYFQQGENWSAIEQAIRSKAKRSGRAFEDITDDERILIINSLLRGYTPGAISLARPGAAKERTIGTIDVELNKFYADSKESLLRYIRVMNSKIAAREFFGAETKLIRRIRGNQGARLTRLAKYKKGEGLAPGTTAIQYRKHIKRTEEAIKADEERLERLKAKQLKETIGGYVDDLQRSGIISPTQERQLVGLLRGVFDPKGMGPKMKVFAASIYLDTLNSVYQAWTQLEELAFAYIKSPIRATPSLLRAVLKKSQVTPEDIGILTVGIEFEGPGLQRELRRMLKTTTFRWSDNLGKETLINTELRVLKAEARKKKPSGSFIRELVRVFGKDYKEVISDIKRTDLENLKRGDIPDNVRYLLWCKVAEIHPIALSQTPEAYNRGGNARIFYTLKTFYLKRFDYLRTKAFQDMKHPIKNPRAYARGFANLMNMLFWFVLLGAGKDLLVDFCKGRPFDLTDSMIDTLVRIALLSKYEVYALPRKGLHWFIGQKLAPPMKWQDATIKDLTTVIKDRDRGFELWNSVPIVGQPYYWWFGRGREKVEAREETSWVD